MTSPVGGQGGYLLDTRGGRGSGKLSKQARVTELALGSGHWNSSAFSRAVCFSLLTQPSGGFLEEARTDQDSAPGGEGTWSGEQLPTARELFQGDSSWWIFGVHPWIHGASFPVKCPGHSWNPSPVQGHYGCRGGCGSGPDHPLCRCRAPPPVPGLGTFPVASIALQITCPIGTL